MKLILLVLAAAPAFCQPAFTVASVKPSEMVKPVVTIDPGRVSLAGMTLKSLITRAYGVKYFQVSGPDWIANEAYAVQATMPPDTPEPQVWQMLQTLLAERFELKLKRSSQEVNVYAVVMGKGPLKMKETAGGASNVRFTPEGIVAKNATIESLSNLMGKLLDRPMVDQTGLTGVYDFVLDYAPESKSGAGMTKAEAELALTKGEAGGASLFTAFQKLGLKLEPRKAPMLVLTVETARRVPTEN